MRVVLYSTANCPMCKQLARILQSKNIAFEKCEDEDYILSLGYRSVPLLQIDDKILVTQEAFTWANNK